MRNVVATARPAQLEEIAQSPVAWGRFVWGTVAIMAAAGVYACLCDAPMIWDGAYQFCFSLIEQEPYKYLTRFHSYILWLPMVLLSHFTSNLAVLKMAYGLPFTLAPAFSVLVSWWVVRKRAPYLVLWAIFGAAASPLPGQIFIINDSIFQQHMFWPVFMGLLVEWPQMIVLSLLAVFQFSHQIGLVLLMGGAGSAALLAIRDRQNRDKLLIKSGICLALAIVAGWKIVHFPDSYAQREFNFETLRIEWIWGVEGYGLRGLEFMWAAGACVLLHGLLHAPRFRELRRMMRFGSIACVVAAAVTWTIYAHDARLWNSAVNWRRYVVPLTIPFYLMAFIDRWTRLGGGASAAQIESGIALRAPVGWMVAATFAIVLSLQSTVWWRLTSRFMHDVWAQPAGLVPRFAIGWGDGTPVAHWGMTAYVFVREGRQPSHLLLDPDPHNVADQLANLRLDPPRVPLAPFTPVRPGPGPAGWFDFRPMVQRVRETWTKQEPATQSSKETRDVGFSPHAGAERSAALALRAQ